MSNAHDEENCVNCGDRRTSDATPTDGVHATCRLCGAVRASRELSTGWVCLDFAACDAKRRSETATTDRNGETEAEFYRKRYLEAHTELERLRRPTATETCDDELNTIEKCRGLVSRAVSVQAAFEALTVLAVQARYRREQRRPTATTKKHESIEAMVERFFNENPGCEGYQHVINQLVTDVTVDEFERGWKSAEECAERAMRVDCPDCEGTGILDACDPYPERKCPTCEPPSEEVLCIVHAFDDQERKDAVRELAARVKATETALATLRQGRESDPIRDRLIRLEGAAGFVVRRIELATSDSLRERIEALKAVLDSEDP
jgi:hypothetical protein